MFWLKGGKVFCLEVLQIRYQSNQTEELCCRAVITRVNLSDLASLSGLHFPLYLAIQSYGYCLRIRTIKSNTSELIYNLCLWSGTTFPVDWKQDWVHIWQSWQEIRSQFEWKTLFLDQVWLGKLSRLQRYESKKYLISGYGSYRKYVRTPSPYRWKCIPKWQPGQLHVKNDFFIRSFKFSNLSACNIHLLLWGRLRLILIHAIQEYIFKLPQDLAFEDCLLLLFFSLTRLFMVNDLQDHTCTLPVIICWEEKSCAVRWEVL